MYKKTRRKTRKNAKYTVGKKLEVQKPNMYLSVFTTATHLAFGYNK